MKKITKEKVKQTVFDLMMLFIACCIGAFSTVGILIPNGLTSGGITGIVRILQNFIDINFSIMYYIGTFIILILCAIFLGIKEAKKIILLSIMYPLALTIMETLNVQLLEQKDIILAVVYCGVFSGICNGIVMSRGYSFGGSDTVAKIIQRKLFPQVTLSKVLLCVDAIVIVSSAFVFGRNIALYALVTTVILSKTIDFYMFGMQKKIVQVEVISEERDAIAEYVMNELGRGVSEIKVKGAYTNIERPKLVILCSPRESVLLRNFVASVDKKALISLMTVDSVWGNGEGFNKITEE